MACSPLLGEIARGLGIQLSQSVALMTVFMLFAALSFFPAGLLSDRLGVRNLMIISTAFAAIGTSLYAVLGGAFGTVLIVRVLQGCSVGFTMAAMVPLVMQWFPPEQRGLALGIPGACNPVGVMVAVLVSPLLYRRLGSWQHALAWTSVAGWFALVYCIVVFHLAKSRMPSKPVQTHLGQANLIFSAAMRNPYTWVGVAASFATNWIMQSAFSLSPSYFAEAKPVGLGMGPVGAGQMMGLVQVGAIIGPIAGGLLLDKVFRNRSRVVLGLGFILSLVYLGLRFDRICQTSGAFLTTLMLAGAGIGILFPMLQSRISEVYDRAIVGRMNGIWLGIGAFGGSAGLAVNAIALKHTNGYALPIAIISAAAAVGLALCFVPASGQKA